MDALLTTQAVVFSPSSAWEPGGLPSASAALDALFRKYASGVAMGTIPRPLMLEARSRLRVLRPLVSRAIEVDVLAWLSAFEASASRPNAPPSPEARTLAHHGIIETCADLPAGVWCTATRLAFQAVQSAWPMPADVHAFLLPYANVMRRQRTGCAAVVEAWNKQQRDAKDDVAAPRTPEAIEAVSRLVRSLGIPPARKPLEHHSASPGVGRRPDSALSPGAMLAIHEQAARSALTPMLRSVAAARAARLRASMGLPPSSETE